MILHHVISCKGASGLHIDTRGFGVFWGVVHDCPHAVPVIRPPHWSCQVLGYRNERTICNDADPCKHVLTDLHILPPPLPPRPGTLAASVLAAWSKAFSLGLDTALLSNISSFGQSKLLPGAPAFALVQAVVRYNRVGGGWAL